jgi:hypothetical protein
MNLKRLVEMLPRLGVASFATLSGKPFGVTNEWKRNTNY